MGAVAIVVIAHIVKGFKTGFEKYFDADAQTMRKLRPICQFGLIARGGGVLIIAYLALMAAWQSDAARAGGMAKALEVLSGTWGSPWQ